MAVIDQVSLEETTYELVPEIAPLFNATQAYAAGDCVIKDAVLYRFTVAHAAGAWVGTDAEKITVGEELTDLSENVGYLKSAIESYSESVGVAVGVMSYVFSKGWYTTPADGSSVEFKADDDAVSVKISISVGDKVTLNASAGSGIGRLYVFIDSNGNAIGRCATNLSGIRTLDDIPSNAVYLAINNFLDKQTDNYYAYKGDSIDAKLLRKQDNLTFDTVPKNNSINPVTSSGVYNDGTTMTKTGGKAIEAISGAHPLFFRSGVYIGATAGNVMNDTPTESNEFICVCSNCQNGDIITINGTGSSGVYRMWYITDENNVVVWSANNNVTGEQIVPVPANSAKIFINLLATSENPYAYNGQSIINEMNLTIPSYYTDDGYLQKRLNKITGIQKNMSVNNDAFWLMSDYHYRYNAGNSIALLKYLSAKTGITRLHYNGDSGGSEGTAEESRLNALQNSAKVWSKLEDNVPEMYGILGNHEWISSDVYGMGAMMAAYLNRFKTKVNNFDAECGAYYVDNAANKIRYFFIQDTFSSYPVSTSVSWLGHQLENMPENYSVAVFVHHGFIPSAYTEQEYGFSVSYNYGSIKAVSLLLKNWKNKANITYDGTEYVYNTTEPENRSVIGVFCAHMHHSTLYTGSEAWAYDTDTDGVTVFRASEDALNEKAIAINNHPWFWAYNETTDEYDIKTERTEGTIHEQCFYCIQIDLNSKHMYITAIGGDRDWDFVYES